MGSCSLCGSREVKLNNIQSVDKLQYNNQVNLKMKTGGMFGLASSARLTLTKPVKYLSYGVQLKDRKLWISASVLPGMDPRGQYEKPCQDTCFARSDGESILLGVYDGHGTEGHRVVDLCQKFIINYYFTNKELYKRNPEDFLLTATRLCDIKLRESYINVTLSGS